MKQTKKTKGTLVILTLNEIEGLTAIYPLIPVDKFEEIFAIDGGSTDGTLDFYKKNKVRVLKQQSKGRGEAFRLAMKYSKYDHLVFFSPDGNENPKDIATLFEYLEKGYDMVIASRFMKGARCDEDDQLIKMRKFGNKFFTFLGNMFFGGSLTDSINGFRGITKKAFTRINPDAHGFGIEYQTSLRALKNRFRIKEIPTLEKERIGGRSTAGTFTVGSYFIKLLFQEMLKK